MNIDTYLQFFREERAGLYKGYKYPNLIEVQKADHLHLGYFADVTDELVLAAFRGEEELTRDEIWQVARYNRIPFSVLTCPKLIKLDWKPDKTPEDDCRSGQAVYAVKVYGQRRKSGGGKVYRAGRPGKSEVFESCPLWQAYIHSLSGYQKRII